MSDTYEKEHVMPWSTPLLVFVALAILTAVTVAFSGLPTSAAVSILIAFSIASAKAALVLAFFMHLKYENKVFLFCLGMALMTFVVVFALVFADYSFRW